MKHLQTCVMNNLITLAVAMAVPMFGQALKVEPIANPAAAGSVEAHWSTAQDGSPLLSWIEPLKETAVTFTADDGSWDLNLPAPAAVRWRRSPQLRSPLRAPYPSR